MRERRGRETLANRGVPAALSAMADAVGTGAAADAALESGERDIAAGLLAERLRVAEAFETTYGAPLDVALAVIDVARHGARGAGRRVDHATRCADRWLVGALFHELGYRDGIAGRAGEPSANDGPAADWMADVARLHGATRAYRRGVAYGSAERTLCACALNVVARIDVRADVLRRWADRWHAGARWAVRSDVRARLVSGARVRAAVADATADRDAAACASLGRCVAAYAAGRARSIRQRAARRLVDIASARASADPVAGAAAVYDLLTTRLARPVWSVGRLLARRAAAGRRSARAQLIEVALDLVAADGRGSLGVIGGDGLPLALRRHGGLPWGGAHHAPFGADAAAQLMAALSRRSGLGVGRAWARAIARSTMVAGENATSPVQHAPELAGDAGGHRLALAECDLIRRGTRATLVAAEGWHRTYRHEAARLPEGAVDRELLTARAAALDAAIDARARAEASALFHAGLALALAEARQAGVRDARLTAVAAAVEYADGVLDGARVTIGLTGATPDVASWVHRVRRAVAHEAALWREVEQMRVECLSWRERCAVAWDESRDAARSVWRWFGRSIDAGVPDRLVSLRLVRARILAIEVVLAVPLVVGLGAATGPITITACAVALGAVYVGAAWRLASLDDPHWWRVGTCTLMLAPFALPVLGIPLPPPSGEPRATAAVAAWLGLAPLMMPVMRAIARRLADRHARRVDDRVRRAISNWRQRQAGAAVDASAPTGPAPAH